MDEKLFKRNDHLREVFNKVAPKFDTIGPNYFSFFGKELVDQALIKRGSLVLDVACGRGASLFPAVEKVGQNGSVVGIDFSEEMTNETNKRIRKESIENACVKVMDAENLNFDKECFDHVLCGLSAPFFSDHDKAINEMYRVIKKGGKVGISTWKTRDKNGVLVTAYKAVFPEEPGAKKISKNKVRPDFGTVEGMVALLEKTGFSNVKISLEEHTFYYKDQEEWWQEQWTNASRELFEQVEQKGHLDKFKEAAFKELDKNKNDLGIQFHAQVLLSYGEK